MGTPAAAAVTPLVVNVLATSPAAGYVVPTVSGVYPVVTPSAEGQVTGLTTVVPYPTSAPASYGTPASSVIGTGSVYASATTSAKGQQYTGGASKVVGGWMAAVGGLAGLVLL